MRRIRCDHCNYSVTDEFSEGDDYARNVMSKFGWSQDDGGDVCPDCAMKMGRLSEILVPESRFESGRFSGHVLRFTLDNENWYEAWYMAEDDTLRSETSTMDRPFGAVVARRKDCKAVAFCNASCR